MSCGSTTCDLRLNMHGNVTSGTPSATGMAEQMPMQELEMEMQESMRALAKEMKELTRASATEAEKSMRALATETTKSMRALASRIKPVVQQERITLASCTEIILDRDFEIVLFYSAVKIPLLVDIGATAFREGDANSATVSRAAIIPRERNAERRAREPPGKCSTPSWQLNIAMSVPMRAMSAASSAATSAEIMLHLSSPNGQYRGLISSVAAYCCVDPRVQVSEGEMSQLIVTSISVNEGAFGVTISQLIAACDIGILPFPGRPRNFKVP